MRYVFILPLVFLLSGCVQPPEAPEPIIDNAAALEYLQPGLRPEILLFPDYLMMDEFELSQHGRIPETELVGAGLRSKLSLTMVRRRFMDELDSNGWESTKLEIEKQSFRLLAVKKLEQIEIRAVQGYGPTEIFILYRPNSVEPSSTF